MLTLNGPVGFAPDRLSPSHRALQHHDNPAI